MKKLIIIFVIILAISPNSLTSQTFKELTDSANYYHEIGEYETAQFWAQLTISKAEKLFGKLDTNYINALIENSKYFRENKSGKDSIFYYDSLSYELSKNIFKNDHQFLGKCITRFAISLNNNNNSAKAEFLFKNALEMNNRLYPIKNKENAFSLIELASFYSKSNNNSITDSLFQEAIKIGRENKNDSLGLAEILSKIGDFLEWKYPHKAHIYFVEALKILRLIPNVNKIKLIYCIKSLAFLNKTNGNYENAISLFEEALEMESKYYKSYSFEIENTILLIANSYKNINNYRKAEQYYSKYLDIGRYKYNKNSIRLLLNIFQTGQFYSNIGNYKQSDPLLFEAISIINYRNQLKEDDSKFYFSFIVNMFANRGNIRKAEELYKGELINSRINSNDSLNLISKLSDLSQFYTFHSINVLAEPLLIEKLDISRKINNENKDKLIYDISDLARYYFENGNLLLAGKLYTEALLMYRKVFKEDNISLAILLSNIAQYYSKINDIKNAENLFLESLEMLKRISNNDYDKSNYFFPFMIREDFAKYYLQNKELKKSEELCFENIEMIKKVEENSITILPALDDLASLYDEVGNIEKANFYFNEYLKNLSKLNEISNIKHGYNKLGNFNFKIGKLKEAEHFYKELIDIYLKEVNSKFTILSEYEKEKYWGEVKEIFESFNTFAVERAKESPAILCNMFDNQLETKSILYNSTNKIKKRILNSNDTNLLDLYYQMVAIKGKLLKLYSNNNSEDKKTKNEIDSLEYKLNNIESKLSFNSEDYIQSYEKKKINWKSIQTLLKPDEAAIEVIRFRLKGKNRFTDTINYALLIVTDQTEDHPDLILLENGNELEKDFYTYYRNQIKNKFSDNLSYKRYWEKIDEKLKGIKKIYFSADGIYNKLNPSTLLMPNGKYLFEMYDIQQVNSCKDIIIGYYQKKQESNIYNSAVLIGNPNFSLSENELMKVNNKVRGEKDEENQNYKIISQTRGIELTKLPGTEIEINNIDRFLQNKKWVVNSYLGDMAVKSAVKIANNPRVLHIATHGMFLENSDKKGKEIFGFSENKINENPLLKSGLFFTGSDNFLKSDAISEVVDDGLLTAYEAMNLDLDKTELVVLSACETGLGEVRNGEGVFGLRRAFQQAGAKSIIMSLWKVSDDATQELMTNFYQNWVSGMTKRDSFYKAQQVIKEKYKVPYYWGAFIMVGE